MDEKKNRQKAKSKLWMIYQIGNESINENYELKVCPLDYDFQNRFVFSTETHYQSTTCF